MDRERGGDQRSLEVATSIGVVATALPFRSLESRRYLAPVAGLRLEQGESDGSRVHPRRPGAGQNAQRRGMKMLDRIQKRMLSGIPARRKSVYLYPPGL